MAQLDVKVNVGSDKIRCCCDANSIFPSLNIQTCLPSSEWIIIDFINLFLSYCCMLNSFLKVLTEVCVDTGLDTLSITCITQSSAKVILVFHIRDIMKMLMKANVYWNGHIKIFIKCIHCWLLKCLIHLEWSDIGLLQTTYPPCICPTQVIALILAPPLPRLTCIVVWPIL